MKKRISLYLIILFIFQIGILNSFASNYIIPSLQDIENNAKKVADWQMANFTYSTTNHHDYGIASWSNAVLYLGFVEWAKIKDENNTYSNWLYNTIGTTSNWKLNGIYPYHADEFCMGQFFSKMYDLYKDEKMMTNTLERVDYILDNPPNSSMSHSNKQAWTWCDATFMAPPLYAQLTKQNGNTKYVEFMDVEFKKMYNHLFDKTEKLFFRDDSYFNKTEANGEKVFWGRGNGWVLAGITNILKELPENSQYRPYYENVYKELALKLIKLQNKSGAWHASLLDPDSYPSAETSATALITYALAYGLNCALLTEQEALRSVVKAWNKLCEAIQANGKLGWIQPIGQDPKTITKDMTATFGVGAFLFASAEIHKLLQKPVELEPEIEFAESILNLHENDCAIPEMYYFPPINKSQIEWHSSNPEVAEVSADGEICAYTEGSTKITATYTEDKSKKDSCKVNVNSSQHFQNVFFDFGTATSTVAVGAIKVYTGVLFSQNNLYGWVSNNKLGDRYLNKPADKIELRGFNVGPDPSIFKVALKKGKYIITITQGDADYPHEYMIVKANGVTKLENITSTKGEYEINSFELELENNFLELEFSKIKQGDPNWVVNSIRIEEKEPSSSSNKEMNIDDFHSGEITIRVYDIQGRFVLEDKFENKSYFDFIQEKQLPKGVYLIYLESGNKNHIVKYSI